MNQDITRMLNKRCKNCKKEFSIPYPWKMYLKRLFCSKSCSTQYCNNGVKTQFKKGSLHPSWRGGISKLDKRIRASRKYRSFRKIILVRDSYKCKVCGILGNKSGFTGLQVDHIKPMSLILSSLKIDTLKQAFDCKKLWDSNNMRTLCISCHSKTDTWGAKLLKGKKWKVTHSRLAVNK